MSVPVSSSSSSARLPAGASRKAANPPLREEHRLGEAPEVESGQGLDLLQLFLHLARQRPGGAVVRQHLRQFHLRGLQRAIGFVPRAPLAPERAVAAATHLELHLREAVRGMPRHEFVAPWETPPMRGVWW